jgi:hypothetical protein
LRFSLWRGYSADRPTRAQTRSIPRSRDPSLIPRNSIASLSFPGSGRKLESFLIK